MDSCWDEIEVVLHIVFQHETLKHCGVDPVLDIMYYNVFLAKIFVCKLVLIH